MRQKNKGVNMDKKTEKVTIFDIADWFLSKEPMTHKKLQKLCYYAQAWSLVLRGTNVADDVEFQAWVHGPVNHSLWRKLKEYGNETITTKCGQNKALEPEVNALLDRVWDTYGEFTGYQLECLTCSELPWLDARKGLAKLAPSNRPIDQKKVTSYYQSIYSGGDV